MSQRPGGDSGERRTRPATPAAGRPRISDRRRRVYRIPVLGAIAYLIWPPRSGRPSIWRRLVSYSTLVIALLGVGMVAYPVAGEYYPFFYKVPVEKLIEWSNFFSDLQTNEIQDRLEDEFLALKDPRLAKDGDPLTRIEIPSIGVDTIVVQGTSASALRAGAGHYPETPLPGAKGNVAIAGHRTTHGRPFNKVDRLEPGDEVILTTPIGRFTYKVTRNPFITYPTDWSVIAQSKDSLLTLTTCHPKGSARQRMIVRAELVKSESIRGAARA